MAIVEIGECSSSSCVIKVGYGLKMNEEDIPDLSSARIFRVPRPLRDSHNSLYSPQLVSIGPFHYRKNQLKEMEMSKSEAVRRMQKRIQLKDPRASIESIVKQRIEAKDREIREFYGEHIPWGSEELAWMVTRDGCFIFEFLVNYIHRISGSEDMYKEEVSKFSWKYNLVFDFNFVSPMSERIMDDILLFENQIPLCILKEILHIKMGSTEGANKTFDFLMLFLLTSTTSHKIFMWYVTYSFNSSSHFLEVLYHGIVGFNVRSYGNTEAKALPGNRMQLLFKKLSLTGNRVQLCFKKLSLPGNRMQLCFKKLSLPGNRMQLCFKKLSLPGNCIQLWFKNGVDLIKAICGRWCKLSSNENPDEPIAFVKLPSAVELTRVGVKISPVLFKAARAFEPICSAIRWIRFDEKTSTLYLPQIRITPDSDLIMRSIVAMEVSIKDRYDPMPMTMFCKFIDELIDNEEDVAVLRKADVIKNFLGSNHQVAYLFNSLPQGIPYRSNCKVIDDVRRGLHKYTKRKYKILWSEFVSAYFSKPWLVAGSMAATLLLLMTVAQVFYLFFTCNP
ncbi:hypothetical protein SUGI_0698900 [Cryptomeria japonica]|uniref:UPF0481 protein At3g47200-like n=1 Tax=Cryptomeria japonica TaxID=3369 RepID=UPI002414ABDA|nr:UPF0481 protein At3g47200-like [Cryptomeria japonica]GLJ34730.1 hypothetical protein SUGI_0698900 [Cryptomeria japonica]